ncbi:hypothetical protein L1887_22914 [Cichorium endivia]|nr:hypothetical protein L1887_22914 [Cichorium endivia]
MTQAPLLFKGIGHSLNLPNSLILKFLSASLSAYSANPKLKLSSPPLLSRSSILLVSVVEIYPNYWKITLGPLRCVKRYKSVNESGTNRY